MKTWIALLLLGSLALLLAGCGGGGGGQTGTPKEPTPTNAVLRTVDGDKAVNAPWVAFQDGDGPWVAVAPGSRGVYSAPVTNPQGRYGFVVGGPAGQQPAVTLYQATLSEQPTVIHAFSPVALGAYRLNGDIAGATPGEHTVTVALGLRTAMPGPLEPYFFALLPAGVYDLAACRRNAASGLVDALYVMRNLGLAGNLTQRVDFTDNTLTATPQTFTLDIPGTATGAVLLLTGHRTALPVSAEGQAVGADIKYAALPPARQHPADLYVANVTQESQNGPIRTRQWTKKAFHLPASQAVTLPGTFASPLLTLPNGVLTATWTPYPDAIAYHLRLNSQDDQQWSVWLSAGWLQGNTVARYPLPTFTGVPGWNPAMAATGGEQAWMMDAITANRPLPEVAAALNGSAYADGMEIHLSGLGVSAGE